MLKNQSGIVLIVILLFLFIFNLLALSSLSNSQLQVRMSNNLAVKNQEQQAVEAGLLQGERLINQSKQNACSSTAVWKGSPVSVGNHCVLIYNQRAVHYIIQPYFKDACLVVGKGAAQQAQLKQGDIYKITAWLMQLNYPVLALQSTYAQAQDVSCVNPQNEIHPGRLSWRPVTLTPD